MRVDINSLTLQEFVWMREGFAESKGAKRKGGTISDERLAALGIEGF